MAQDYEIASFTLYAKPGGGIINSNNLPDGTLIGGDDTDDDSWDVGDAYTNGSGYSFVGHYTEGGHLFLVFESPSFYSIVSPTAASGDPAYPSNYVSDPAPVSASSQATCFAEGTRIATADGDRAVEALEIGDLVLTATGATVPVRWIGRQTLHRAVMGARFQPVRIRAGALGDCLPHADLTVTADHGMVIDGLVINAAALVNGTTIDWVPMAELPDSFTVYHIETEAHDVILAEGAPAETFIDYIGRQAFDNAAEYLALYGAERIIPEMPQPRISSARLLPGALRQRLNLADPAADLALAG
ncbi:Hint domain-containing protein [Marinovum sp.]|uniref:Hint domain-containing protein n=1 Tax=Marinovum sp. TaxID=2024839 RepID=UPI002B265F95|nr:Hint domain-containing protein [Marinovum sp.]